MIRTALSLALLAGALSAQHVEQGTLRPATLPRRGGVLDWASGTWKRGAAGFGGTSGYSQNAPFPIYNNTCSWSGGLFFIDSQTCWERYDDGRIPTTVDPFPPGGPLLCDCYTVCGLEIAYCTSEAPGNVALQLGFYEGLLTSGVGGFCTGFQTTGAPPSGGGLPKPPGNLGGPRDFFIDLSAAGLPADPGGGGTQTCWIITIDLSNVPNGGFSFCGNDDIVFDNAMDRDLFNWVWSQDGTTSVFGATGPLLAGDPLTSPPGGGSFDTAGGIDTVTGQPCGTGYGNADAFWVNVDGQGIGQAGPPPCGPMLPGATNCYFMGGWPGNPWAGLYLKMWGDGTACAPGPTADVPVVYCTAKPSSSGCLASIQGSNPLAQPVSGADDYDVIATNVEGLRAGIFFYGITGPNNLPFLGGWLCVKPQLGRTPIQFSLGSVDNCDGQFVQRINDGSLFNMDLGPGTSNWIQAWYRDPELMDGFDSALSDAIEVTFQ